MRKRIKFFVAGFPMTKGSLKFVGMHGGKPWLVNSCTKEKGWAAMIKDVAKDYFDSPIPDEVEVSLEFILPLNKKELRKKKMKENKETGVWIEILWGKESSKKTKKSPHIKQPDVDKLCRSVLDALDGIVYNCDSQVYKLKAVKITKE